MEDVTSINIAKEEWSLGQEENQELVLMLTQRGTLQGGRPLRGVRHKRKAVVLGAAIAEFQSVPAAMSMLT